MLIDKYSFRFLDALVVVFASVEILDIARLFLSACPNRSFA